MSKSQRTPIPLPGSAPSKRKTTVKAPSTKQSFKSQEFIESSDESAAEERSQSNKAKKQKETKSPAKIGVHRPNGVSKKSEIPLPSAKPPSRKVEVQELDSSSSSSHDESAKTQKDLPQKKGVENTGASTGTTASSTDESDSDSSSNESGDETSPTTHIARQIADPQPQSHTVDFRPVQPFVPPKGFNAVPTPIKTTSSASKLFEDLDGKQVWHISAPADIPLSHLESLAMNEVLKGNAVLSHEGSDYGLISRHESEEAARAVLTPRTDGYEAVPVPITQTFHLQQILRLPNITPKQSDQNTGSAAAAGITRSTIRAPRPQVKGLKMRYFHSGFGDGEPGTIGLSDDEDYANADTAGLGMPNGAKATKKPEKRKHEGVNGATESPSKKHKKQKTTEELKKKDEKRAKKEKKRATEAVKAKS